MQSELVTVNVYRMRFARERAGLTVRQVAMNFDIDVRPGEYFGRMPPEDLHKVQDLYGVCDGWLAEEGPVADPQSITSTLDMVGAVDEPYICRRIACHGHDGPCDMLE